LPGCRGLCRDQFAARCDTARAEGVSGARSDDRTPAAGRNACLELITVFTILEQGFGDRASILQETIGMKVERQRSEPKKSGDNLVERNI
jgi:hypothetical protein